MYPLSLLLNLGFHQIVVKPKQVLELPRSNPPNLLVDSRKKLNLILMMNSALVSRSHTYTHSSTILSSLFIWISLFKLMFSSWTSLSSVDDEKPTTKSTKSAVSSVVSASTSRSRRPATTKKSAPAPSRSSKSATRRKMDEDEDSFESEDDFQDDDDDDDDEFEP